MMSGDVGTVQSRIDMHCIPITTQRSKNQRCRLTNRICTARIAALRMCGEVNTRRKARASQHRDVTSFDFLAILKNPCVICVFAQRTNPRVLSKTDSRKHFSDARNDGPASDVLFLSTSKKFSTDRLKATTRESGFDQKRANRVKVIR